MPLLQSTFLDRLEAVLEAVGHGHKAAVAVVQDRDHWLLGLAKATRDDRTGKWCMPGGMSKPGETPEQTAVRECREETGVHCRAVGKPFYLPDKRDVAFVHCRVTSHNPRIKHNHEFSTMGFFTVNEMKALRLYKNVKTLIHRVRSQ